MLVSSAKAAVKSIPFLYDLLFPVARFWRRLRNRHTKESLSRFRRYCAVIPDLVQEPYFVKVGANDGITGDPCSDILLADPRWKGLLIEPVPYCFDRLRAEFSDPGRFSLEKVAVGAPAGEELFYYVDPKARDNIPNLPDWYDQIGSFSRNHIVKHLQGVLEPFIVESKVKVIPLSSLLRRKPVKDVHLLHVDTEGHDDEVLKTLDLRECRPLLIFVEHKHLSNVRRSEMLRLLRSHGYAVEDCGGDYFALDEQANELLNLPVGFAPPR